MLVLLGVVKQDQDREQEQLDRRIAARLEELRAYLAEAVVAAALDAVPVVERRKTRH